MSVWASDKSRATSPQRRCSQRHTFRELSAQGTAEVSSSPLYWQFDFRERETRVFISADKFPSRQPSTLLTCRHSVLVLNRRHFLAVRKDPRSFASHRGRVFAGTAITLRVENVEARRFFERPMCASQLLASRIALVPLRPIPYSTGSAASLTLFPSPATRARPCH